MTRTHRLLISRRHALALPLTALAAGALASCGGGAPVVPIGTPGAGASSAASPGLSGPSAPSSIRVEGVLGGHSLDLAVGPLVRYDQTTTVLLVHVARPADDPNTEAELDVAAAWFGTVADDLFSSRPLRLADPASNRVWVTTLGGSLPGGVLAPGDSADLHPTFGGVEEGVESVVVMLPRTGFYVVDVVGRDQAGDVNLDGAVRDAAIDPGRAGALPLEQYTEAVDDSASQATTDETVTVSVASDVSFTPDSAVLTEEADGILKGLSATIAAYPDGGDLAITGHTDDVDEDSYNQALSERRAQAVSDRLGELTDLSAWAVTVSGKGEGEPRVVGTDDAARAANRRVEVVLTPVGGTSADDGAEPGASQELPGTSGPTAAGPDGVEVPGGAGAGGPLTIRLDQVTRRAGLLFAEIVISGGRDYPTSHWFTDGAGYGLTNARGETGSVVSSIVAASGVTLLNGGNRLFPVDYLPEGAQAHRPLAELYVKESLQEGMSSKILMVWPDTGADTVVVDRPEDVSFGAAPWRLTDVPVVDA